VARLLTVARERGPETCWLATRFASPIMLEVLAMPFDDRLVLHDDYGSLPLAQETTDRHPEDAVAVVYVRALHAAFVDRELLAQRDIIESELRALLDRELEQVEEEAEGRYPRIIVAA
jgi:hypothetical protein